MKAQKDNLTDLYENSNKKWHEYRCECGTLIVEKDGKLEEAVKRHKCKITRSEKADRIINFVRENP